MNEQMLVNVMSSFKREKALGAHESIILLAHLPEDGKMDTGEFSQEKEYLKKLNMGRNIRIAFIEIASKIEAQQNLSGLISDDLMNKTRLGKHTWGELIALGSSMGLQRDHTVTSLDAFCSIQEETMSDDEKDKLAPYLANTSHTYITCLSWYERNSANLTVKTARLKEYIEEILT